MIILAELAANESTFKLLIQYFGFPGAIFLIIIFCLYKGYLITGREAKAQEARYNELKEEKNYWRDLALRSTNVAEKATDTAKRLVNTEP